MCENTVPKSTPIDVKYFVGINPCLSVKCTKDEECKINKLGIAECHCPSNCEPIIKPICSNDGRTFSSECEMKKIACKTRETIEISHMGICGEINPCTNRKCRFGSVCTQKLNKTNCECPICSTEFNPVCGSDGITYENECKLWLESCKHQRNITLLYKGSCSKFFLEFGVSFSLLPLFFVTGGCENKKCDFYSTCESNNVAEAACVCPKSCENEQVIY